jgi:hypothetical protein
MRVTVGKSYTGQRNLERDAQVVVQRLRGPCMTFLLRVILALGLGLATAALL